MKKLLLVILATMSLLTISSQNLMTIGEVFDFDIGDEYQISGNGYNQPPNADRITITNKYFSNNSDTVFYVRYHDSYYSYIEFYELFYVFWTETDTVFYMNLDSCISSYNYWTPYDPIMINYDTINFNSEDYCDSLICGFSYELNSFEPVYYSRLFGKGLGLVKDYYYAPAEFSEMDNVLFYYKKNGVACGSPDTLTVSISENSLMNSINIFPNPANTTIFITNSSSLRINEINLFNIQGQRILHKNAFSKNLDISQIEQGLYVLELISDELRIRKKLIIE